MAPPVTRVARLQPCEEWDGSNLPGAPPEGERNDVRVIINRIVNRLVTPPPTLPEIELVPRAPKRTRAPKAPKTVKKSLTPPKRVIEP